MSSPSCTTHDVLAYFGGRANHIPHPEMDCKAARLRMYSAFRPASFRCANNYEARTWHMNIRTIS